MNTSTTSSRPEPQKTTSGWNRRTLLATLPLSLLAGCSSDRLSSENYVRLLLAGGLNPFASPPGITRKEAAAISYASIALTVGSGPQTMLVLATAAGGAHLWTSSARIALQTVSGRVIRTGGLAHNLSDTGLRGADPLATGLNRVSGQETLFRMLDFADRGEFGVSVSSRFSSPQDAEIEILGTKIKTVQVTEACRSAQLGWEFENQYWADIDTGMIWQSIQTVHPDLAPLTIQTLRPAES